MALRQAIVLGALAWLVAPATSMAQVERFAVVMGNDVGQPPDVQLRYAEVDASRMAAVLQDVAGVRPENLVLLRGRDAATARRALIAVNERVRAAGGQTMLLVYYSGHADVQSLHLGATSLELSELEQLVRGSAATFRLLVVDACRSGALTRVKGGTPIPPFEIRTTERLGEGAVFLTSSAASEDSQESDELKGSFFTHALVSGLLGAADENGDGQVTLDEAYRHAYQATLRASSRTLAGTQHPTFQYELRGQGHMVLATLEAKNPTRSWVVFPKGKTWLLLQETQDGAVTGEVGVDDRVRRLNVRAGRYFVRGRGPNALLEGSLDARAGAAVEVDESRLRRTAYARLVRKGEGDAGMAASVELAGRMRTSLVNDGGACIGFNGGVSFATRSLTISPRIGWCRSGFEQLGLDATVDQLDVELTAEHVWDLSSVSIGIGITAGATLFRQTFRTAGIAPPRTTGAVQLAPSVTVTGDVGRNTYLFATAAGATYLLKSQNTYDGKRSFGPSFALQFSVGTGLRL